MFDTIIANFDALYPNDIPFEQKKLWLERLEEKLRDRLAVRDTDGLVGKPPYDEIYTHYLAMKVAARGGDTVRCNNATAAFDAAERELANSITRRTKSEQTRYRHVFDLL